MLKFADLQVGQKVYIGATRGSSARDVEVIAKSDRLVHLKSLAGPKVSSAGLAASTWDREIAHRARAADKAQAVADVLDATDALINQVLSLTSALAELRRLVDARAEPNVLSPKTVAMLDKMTKRHTLS